MMPAPALAALAMLALGQAADAPSAVPVETQSLRYARPVLIPSGAQGQVCAALDATVYAHAAAASARDLRLFAASSDGVERETPFAMSESATQPAETESAAVEHASVRGSDLVFDLIMPHRAYSGVDLKLNAKDFVATATVTGSAAPDGPVSQLGVFTLFDLTGEHLGRSTTLALAEATFPTLHITLHLTTPEGAPWPQRNAGMVTGAVVPPSRAAQVLYTVVAKSVSLAAQGQRTLATFAPIPEHVPLERVTFVTSAGFHGSFLRAVTLSATPIGGTTEQAGTTETVRGEIGEVNRPATPEGAPAVHESSLHVDATLGANLYSAADVRVAIDNGSSPPLPLAAVALEMRRRSLCFDATPGTRYTLRYGDASLAAPMYEYARSFVPSAHPLEANLGPERQNPRFRAQSAAGSYEERHPEFLWVGLLVVIAALGLTALESVKRRRHG